MSAPDLRATFPWRRCAAMGLLAGAALSASIGCGHDLSSDRPEDAGSFDGSAGSARVDATLPDRPAPAHDAESDRGSVEAASRPDDGRTMLDVTADDGLGPHPTAPSPITAGGTMTFTQVGAAGWWPRRIDRPAGDPACDYKDGTDTWGGHCCMKQQPSSGAGLSPFDEETTLLLKAVAVERLDVYQPDDEGGRAPWRLVSRFDDRLPSSQNLWLTRKAGAGEAMSFGDFTRDDCVGYVMQSTTVACGDGHEPFCPSDPGILHRGWRGSKMFVMLVSMDFPDGQVRSCNDATKPGHPGPWIALVASELTRDGGRKWNGLCNCYSKSGTVGDGCGELNVFEVVMDGNEFSNREFASTGLRSFQAGHVGGSVCGVGCDPRAFAADQDVVDACKRASLDGPAVLDLTLRSEACPVWRRPRGARYLVLLLDAGARTIQLAVVHPEAIPAELGALLPSLPPVLQRPTIDAMLDLRLPR